MRSQTPENTQTDLQCVDGNDQTGFQMPCPKTYKVLFQIAFIPRFTHIVILVNAFHMIR